MSQWTHVNASIRIDDLRMPGFGTDFLEGMDHLPEGSEGPLQYHITENTDPDHLAAYTVNIWGDLRDYDDATAICEFFYLFTKGKMIRSGILEIEVEYREISTYRFNTDDKVWMLTGGQDLSSKTAGVAT